MEYAVLVLTVAGVVLGWGMLKRTLKIGEEMSLRKLEQLNDEQKVIATRFYEKLEVSEDSITAARANKKMLDNLNI